MNLNHLAIFQAAAACSSISGGARLLHISQSAVSKQLGEFEKAQGVVLFDRLPRGVRLTEAGRMLLGYANRIFSIEREAENALKDLRRLVRGRIAIGASRTIGGYMLPGLLAAFRRRFPDVELSLQVDNTQAIESKLVAGEIDIGFAEGIINSEDLDYQVFGQDELALIAAPAFLSQLPQTVSLASLSGLPYLMHEPGSGTRAVTEIALAAKKIRIRASMTLASTEAIKQTVATGIGVAFLSLLTVQTECAANTLVVVPVRRLRIRRPLYRVQLKTASPSPSLAAFLGMLEGAGPETLT